MSLQGSRAGSGVRSEVASLLAARRPSALPALARELEGRQPDPDTVIRLAELLARGGRRGESARLLRGVIEQQAAAGRLAPALAALKRLERLGASDDALVEGLARRALDALPPLTVAAIDGPTARVVEPPHAEPAASAPDVAAPPPEGAPSVAAEEPPAAVESVPVEAVPVESTPPEPVPASEPQMAAPQGTAEPAAPSAAEERGPTGPPPGTAASTSGPLEVVASRPTGMAFRLRTVFRRLLSLEEGEAEPPAAEPALTVSAAITGATEPAAVAAAPEEPPAPAAEAETAAETPASDALRSTAGADAPPSPAEPDASPFVEESAAAPVHEESAAAASAALEPAVPPELEAGDTGGEQAADSAGAPSEVPSTGIAPFEVVPADVASPEIAPAEIVPAVAAPAPGDEPPQPAPGDEPQPAPEAAPQAAPEAPQPPAAGEADGEPPGKRESGFFRSLWRRIVGDDEDDARVADREAEAATSPSEPLPQAPAAALAEDPAAAPPVPDAAAPPLVELASDTAALESLFTPIEPAAPPAPVEAAGPEHAEAPAEAGPAAEVAPLAEAAAPVDAVPGAAEPGPPPSGTTSGSTEPLSELPLAQPSLDARPAGQPAEEAFQGQLLDMIEDILHQPVESAPEPEPPPHPEARYIASPLFAGLSEVELMSVIQGLDLVTCEPGQILFTEGEPGDSLFILTTGSVKAWIRNPLGHSVQVREMREGDFFGEVAVLSGQPRSATVVAAGACELFRLDRPTLDRISAAYPKVRATLEAAYQARTGSPEEKTIRQALIVDATTEARAEEVLRAYFGDRAWDPRMRLRLADLLLKSGKPQQALPILVELADDLIREGFPEKAIAILKKIERIQGRPASEMPLADLLEAEERGRRARRPAVAPEAPRPRVRGAALQSFLQDWVVDLVRDTVARGQQAATPTSRGLAASPLFADFSEDELLALIRGLRLTSCDPGEVILTEGEPGSSVFILASGSVRVHVRGPHGGDVEIVQLPEGDFFGEISALSGRPRSATVTAAARCELLELDPRALDALATTHPRVRAVLEETYLARAGSPLAAQARAGEPRRTG